MSASRSPGMCCQASFAVAVLPWQSSKEHGQGVTNAAAMMRGVLCEQPVPIGAAVPGPKASAMACLSAADAPKPCKSAASLAAS